MLESLSWGPDPKAEAKLRQISPDLKLEVTLVPFGQIDRDWGMHNNARGTAKLNGDIVIEYADAMLTGATFPAVVLRRLPATRLYGPLSGNHRLGGVDLLVAGKDITEKKALIGAYVLDTTDEMLLDIFLRCANRTEGMRQGKSEAINHCLVLMDRYPLKAAALADYFGVKESDLTGEIRTRRAREALHKVGVNVERLPKATVLKLGTLDHSEPLMRLTGQFIAAAGLTATRAAELVSEVKAAKSEDGGRDVVLRWRDQVKQEKAPAPVTAAPERKRRTRLVQCINSFHAFVFTGNSGKPFRKLVEMEVTDTRDRSELFAKWKALKRHVDTLFHDAQQEKK